MSKIASIKSYKVINSRGDWTLRTQVTLDDGSIGVETIPDGASKGENEAIYLPIESALESVNVTLNKALSGSNPFDQEKIDKAMLELDGTDTKKNLGGNSILSISLATAKAAAFSKKLPLFKYLNELYEGKEISSFPTPVFNILNGGKHAHNKLSFQEFMVIPSKKCSYDKALEMGVNIYHALKKSLWDKGFDVDVGDEGGFAPTGFTPSKALGLISEVVKADYKIGEDVFLGMDVAAESFWNDGIYDITEENLRLDRTGLLKYYESLIKEYALIYIEDPFFEEDHEGWEDFSSQFSKKLMVVADDLVVTNVRFLEVAIKNKLANSVIVKPNQVGTLTETFDFIRMAKKNHMNVVVSHRSGDTAEDTFIADLAVAVGADFIKSGAPARGERVAKYNRLLEIFYSI